MDSRPLYQRHPYLVVLVVSFGVFVAADDLTVVSTLLPQMISDFAIPVPTGLDDAAWIVSAYLIAYIVTMPFMGRISDMVGRLNVYLLSLGLFLAGSIAVPLATTLPWLIVFRVVQALGGGAMVPVAMAIVGDLFPQERRAMAMGVLVAVDTAGWIFGPLYGSFLVRVLDWRWQFYLNVPASLLAAAGAYWALRAAPQTRRRVPLDLLGALLLGGSLVALNVAVSAGGGQASSGPSFEFDAPPASTAAQVWPLLVVAALLIGLLVIRERRAPHPLIELEMFRRPNLALAGLINLFAGAALIIAMVDVPLFVNTVQAPLRAGALEEIIQWAAVRSGLILAAMTGSMALASLLGGWLCARRGYRLPTLAGLLTGIVAFVLLGSWSPATDPWRMAAHLSLAGLGFGLLTSPLSTAVIDAAGETQRGIASGLVLILRLMGMSVGLSLLTTWGLERFAELSARYTLGELAGVITDLTAQVLNETFLAAGLVLLLAVPAVLWLRRPPAAG